METEIHSYSESDMISLVRIWNESGLCRKPLSLQQMRNLFAQSRVGLVLTQKGRAVGALRAVSCADGLLAQLAVIELAVLPDCRRKGLGKRLFIKEMELLQAQGFAGILLPVIREDNEAAVRLCTSCGLQKTGILPDYYGKGKPACIFYYACEAKKQAGADKHGGTKTLSAAK